MKRIRCIAVRLTLVLSCGLVARAGEELDAKIASVVDADAFKQAHWGILIVDRGSGDVLYERNADKLFAPASTTKLYSVAAALDALGADYRFETPVVRRGELDGNGVLAGDLILVGSGDLTFGGRSDAAGHIVFKDSDHTYANGNETAELTDPDPLGGLNELARTVASRGIQRVRGEVWVDDRLFERAEGSGSGPSRITPILVNDNVIDIVIRPTTPGAAAEVVCRPETAAYRLDAQVDTAAKDGGTSVEITTAGPGGIAVRGRIAAGHRPLVRIYEVENAASFARSLFIEALRRAGVVVDASPLVANRTSALPPFDEYKKLPRVAVLQSPPFAESARLILKVSHNLHASTLPLLVAVKNGKGTLGDGLRLERDFLIRAGVDAATISFGGGAGGSRADYTTPRATVQLLRYMRTRPDFAAYEQALPVLGVDGTLATAVKADSPARGKVRAKTGTLYWDNGLNGTSLLTSKALAGYMTTASGRELVLAMFVNNAHLENAGQTGRVGRVLGQLCELVYEEL